MLIIVSIGIICFGLLLKRYYKKGFFHNSISIPIIVLGTILLICSLIGIFQNKRAISIFDLSSEQIETIKIIYAYNYKIPSSSILKENKDFTFFLNEIKKKELLINNQEITEWYIDIKITLKSGKELFAVLTKNTDGFVFSQVYYFWFVPIADKEFRVSDEIELLFQ